MTRVTGSNNNVDWASTPTHSQLNARPNLDELSTIDDGSSSSVISSNQENVMRGSCTMISQIENYGELVRMDEFKHKQWLLMLQIDDLTRQTAFRKS